MKRRSFCRALAVGCLALVARARAQSPRPLRLAWASIESGATRSPYLDAFRDGMRELGYKEGANLVIVPDDM